ncbi:MAG: hypothetical protein V4515_14610 [Chloroflexota bacterium]
MTYVKVFLGLAFLASVIVAVTLLRNAVYQIQPDARPTAAPVEGYELSYAVDGGNPVSLVVDPDGRACEALKRSEYLRVACVLATNKNPRVIAGAAFGKLNNEDTPAFEAILWRARMDSNPTFCDDSGLLEPRLGRCHAVAGGADYEVSRSGITVRISADSSIP